MYSLDTLKPGVGTNKAKKRVGRGDGSGHGTYSTRGLKGQKSRTGGRSGIQKRALKDQILLRTPKVRGFKSLNKGYESVNVGDFSTYFKEGDKITVPLLAQKGLVSSIRAKVKVLGDGEAPKSLTVCAHAFSKTAIKAITQKSGKIVLLT